MTGYCKLYGSHGCGQRHLIYMHHKRAIETCRILCSQTMVTFTDHLSHLHITVCMYLGNYTITQGFRTMVLHFVGVVEYAVAI